MEDIDSKSTQSSGQIEKQEIWKSTADKVEDLADTYGVGIEEGIKEAVIAFNVNGLPTEQSCEGHDFSFQSGVHTPWPWIRVCAPDKPVEKVVGENLVYEEVAKRENVDLEKLKRGWPEELYNEVRRRLINNEETEEYKKWSDQNRLLYNKAISFLNEFYQNRKVPPDIEIIADDDAGPFEVRSRDDRTLKIINRQLTEEDKLDLMRLLPLRQKEMMEFTEFLKQHYQQS